MERMSSLDISIHAYELANEVLKNNLVAVNNSSRILLKKLNSEEQRTFFNYVEIVGVPADRNDNFVGIVKKNR